jgi:hypothetical protein
MLKHAHVGVSLSGLLAILGAAPLAGCTDGLEVTEGTVVTETRDLLYVSATANLWTNNNYQVPVCWHPNSTGSDPAKALFEQVVREQWEANTGLTFTGFAPCTSTDSPWVPVEIKPCGGACAGGVANYGIGARLGGPGSPQLSIVYDDSLEAFPWFIAHEMGHVLAAIHEHKRPDGDDGSDHCVLPRGTDGQTTIEPGQLFATVHDPLSTMNYCSGLNNAGSSNLLSALDVVGGQMLYGPPATATRELGFMRVDGSSLPPAYSFNSTGTANSFIRHSVGSYTAIMPRLGKVGGNVQVTPFSFNRCSINGWSSGSSSGVSVAVLCHNSAGLLADSAFGVSFVGSSDGPGGVEGGYVWAFDPTSDFYSAVSGYSWNSTGQPVNIDRTSAGVYDVFFVGQNFSGGTAEVSAYGGGTHYCKLDSLALVNSDKRVRVRCFTRTGTPADVMFSLRLNRGSPMGTPTYSYALADQPTNTQPYVPSSSNRVSFRQNMIGGTTNLAPLTVRRSSQGAYVVELPQMPFTTDPLYLYKKSNLHVTAVGTGNEYCALSTLTGDSLNEHEQASHAHVICMNGAGTAFADSRFIISYGSMVVDAPDSTILSTVERLPQSGLSGIGGLARVGTNLYFTRSFDNVAGGQIMRLSTSGGTPTSIVAGQSATGLFADSTNLIWIGAGSVKKSTLTGGTITTLTSNQSLLNGDPTADSNNVYYRQAVNQMGRGQKIMKVSRNGGTPVLLTTDDVTSDLFTDGTSVYWSAMTATGGRIAKISVNGGAVTVLATRGAGGLVRSGATLYYTDGATNDLYKVPTAGGTSTRIATGIAVNGAGTVPVAAVWKLATDGTNVYGATAAPGYSIFKASVNGGTPAPKATYLAFHEAMRSSLVLDTSNVYFVATTGPKGYLTLSRTTK